MTATASLSNSPPTDLKDMCAEAANDEELGLDRLDTKGSQSFVSCSQLSSVPHVAYFFSGGLYDTYMHIYIYIY